MTNESQLRVVASFIVSDFAKAGSLARQEGQGWVLAYGVAGLAAGTSYSTREALIDGVVTAYTEMLKRHGTLQVAS